MKNQRELPSGSVFFLLRFTRPFFPRLVPCGFPVLNACTSAFRLPSLIRPDQTVLAIPNQVFPAGGFQRLDNKPSFFRPAPLQQGPLHGLLVECLGHIHRLHCPRVDSGIVHAGGEGARRRVKILHLLRLAAGFIQILRQGCLLYTSGSRCILCLLCRRCFACAGYEGLQPLIAAVPISCFPRLTTIFLIIKRPMGRSFYLL